MGASLTRPQLIVLVGVSAVVILKSHGPSRKTAVHKPDLVFF